jgi:hypothetical protein
MIKCDIIAARCNHEDNGSIFKGETVARERVEWIDMILNRDTWWPVLVTAINYLIAQNAGNF